MENITSNKIYMFPFLNLLLVLKHGVQTQF